jgi:hypothetical protein
MLVQQAALYLNFFGDTAAADLVCQDQFLRANCPHPFLTEEITRCKNEMLLN